MSKTATLAMVALTLSTLTGCHRIFNRLRHPLGDDFAPSEQAQVGRERAGSTPSDDSAAYAAKLESQR